MPDFKEYRRDGKDNYDIINPQEQHLPCIVLVDTSGSMKAAEGELLEGLQILGDSIKQDENARGRVELSVIGFDDEARILQPFGPVDDYEVPDIDCAGTTALHEAVDLALNEIEARKDQYRREDTEYYRPWIFLLTDGVPTDVDNGAFGRLLDAQNKGKTIFFPVGIGNYDLNTLKGMHKDGLVLEASYDNFKNAFLWLSKSIASTSVSKPGTSVPLPDPTIGQLTIVS